MSGYWAHCQRMSKLKFSSRLTTKSVKCDGFPHVEANAGSHKQQNKSRKIIINSVTKGPNSLLIKIGKQKYRALVDSGAEVSLIHRRVFHSLKNKPKLRKHDLSLATAGNTPLKIDGFIELEFCIGGIKMLHKFYVIQNLNRNVIIGLDWLQSRGVRVYHDLGCVRVNQTCITLVDDVHIASIARLKNKVTIPPQTAHIRQCQVRRHSELPTEQEYAITPFELGQIGNEPGLLMMNSIAKLSGNHRLPVMLVNTTNKTLSFKSGTPVAYISLIHPTEVMAINKKIPGKLSSPEKSGNVNNLDICELDNLSVPPEHKNQVIDLITKNIDLFANTDVELSHTDTVRMKIDTSEHPPINLKPYHTQLNNRKVIDKAIDEMLGANIIERSRSSWSFSVVIVDKNDGSKRFCVDFRKLNKITKSNSYPLPVIDDILAVLGRAKYFSSLDLKSGYWQVLMDENDKDKTAFSCHRGLF